MNTPRTNSNQQIFLATTALEEFWDTDSKLLFLGEWCRTYDRKIFWEKLNGRVLSSPFQSNSEADAAYRYVDEIYERLLPLLGSALNALHTTQHGTRYWRIVLGPWLQLYIFVMYDRYSHLRLALEQYPDYATIVMAEESFVVPSHYQDFAWFIKEDSFNLQICTKILGIIGKKEQRKKSLDQQQLLKYGRFYHSGKGKIRYAISRLQRWIAAKTWGSVFLKGTYFPKRPLVTLLFRSLFRVQPIISCEAINFGCSVDHDRRNNQKEITTGESEFEHCLSRLLWSDMPTCLIERYADIGAAAETMYPRSPRAILSATAWYADELFKHWAAASAENGTLLCGTPHGGNYGGMAVMLYENHETAIVDRYYSWGWQRTDCAARVIPFPANKLLLRKKIGACNRKTGILWATTAFPRYPTQFPSVPGFFQEYLVWHLRFATTLSDPVRSVIRLRPHREDGGWGIVDRILKCVPGLPVETWDVTFQDSLENCRLYVCDHFSTTFAEALAANKPSILFWNSATNALRDEAKPYHDLLRQAHILFDSPEQAAAVVGEIYDDVETWWNDAARQSAVMTFCEKFARTSPDAIDQWAAEFKRLSQK